MEDGIYFGLPEDEYHRIERFSGSGAQAMLVSPATFWAGSWLNPEKAKAAEEGTEDAKAHQIIGRAYHKARLEPELFVQIYYRGLRLADYPDALTTHDAIKEKLGELGQPKTTAGEKVMSAALRLRDAGYTKPIKHLLEEDHASAFDPSWQIELPWMAYDQIAADIEALHDNAAIQPYLREGISEVTVLWTDDKGVKWKCRFDRLQIQRIVDLKTFDNTRGKTLEQCLYDAVQYNRYHIQAYVYWTAAELIRAGKLKIRKCQSQEQKDLIEAIRASEDPFEYWWVFQEKNGIPNVLARRLIMTEEPHPSHLAQAPTPETRKALAKKLRSPSMIWEKAGLEVKHARDLLLQCLEIWPTGKWGSLHPVGEMDDEGFNQHWLGK